ncbi:MAG: SurA N-terminal domain-containing protein [Bacteroidia bacterium]|nr:SurA N-terminal domain-containing protein [Bacteroidia bacterium]
MAILENIRSKAGTLVAIIIGLSLLAFVLSDMLESGKSIFSGKKTQIAEIGGKAVQWQEYTQMIDELENIYKINSQKDNIDQETVDQIMEQTWTSLIKTKVMEEVYDDLGIAVSSDELFDMVQGNNLHPIIKQLFADKETGQVNTANIIKFLKSKDQDQTGKSQTYWLYIEKEITSDRLFTKFKNLVKQGMYTTSHQAKMSLDEKNHLVDFNYVVQKYASIPDSTVKVNDSELKDYYSKHGNDYKQEATRDIIYISYDVTPSGEDRAGALKWIEKVKPEFEKAENDSLFVEAQSDNSFNDKAFKKSDMPKPLDSALWDASAGTIYGPYFADNAFKLAKLSKIKMLPDSVRASHILIKVDQKMTKEKAHATIDSLKKLIKGGMNFAALAMKHSNDAGSAQKGGDVGWFTEGKMVKPFEYAAFNGKKGDLVIVDSQFGVHLILITDKGKEMKKVQLAIVERKLEPSNKTFQKYYADAIKFATSNRTKEKFEASVSQQNLTKRVGSNIKENDKTIPGMEQAREVVRWAYKAKKNEISPVFELTNRYIIALLTEIRDKGIAPFEQVKTQIESIVKKDKKFEMISKTFNESIARNASLDEIAKTMKTTVDTAKAISFSSFQIPNLGVEPNVIATASLIDMDKLSQPINGSIGAFIIKVVNVSKGTDTNVKAEQDKLTQGAKSRSEYQAFEAMKTMANIGDYRAKFY